MFCFFYEFIRYEGAIQIASLQHDDAAYILEHTACNKESVRSIEHKGSVYDCRAIRLSSQKTITKKAFTLWWYTSWWVTGVSQFTSNTFALTVVIVISIIAFIWIAFQACLHSRMQDKMERYMLPPPPVPNYVEPKCIEYNNEYQDDLTYRLPRKTVKIK